MKKLYGFMMLMLSMFALNASAAEFGEATMISPGAYAYTLDDFIITWNFQELQLVSSSSMAGMTFSNTPATVKYGNNKTASFYFGLLNVKQSEGAWGDEPDNVDALNAVQFLAWDSEPDIDIYGNLPTGVYEITIPAGTVKLKSDGNVKNTATTFTINILNLNTSGADVTPEIHETYTPEEMSELTFQWRINSKTGPYSTLTLNPGMPPITYQNLSAGESEVDGGNTAPINNVPADKVKVDGTKLIVDLSFLDVAGNYEIKVPAGFVTMNDKYIAAEESYSFTLSIIPTMAAGVVVTPEKSLKALIGVSYNGLTIKPTSAGLSAKWSDEYFMKNGQDVPATAFSFYESEAMETASQTSGTVLAVDLTGIANLTAGQTLYVQFPKGIVQDEEGNVNPEQTFEVTILEYADDPTVEGPNADDVITISWPDIEYLSFTNSYEGFTLEGEESEITLKYGENITLYGSNNYEILVNLGGLDLENGDYTLVIPAGAIAFENYMNNEYSYEFTFRKGMKIGNPEIEYIISVLEEEQLTTTTTSGVKLNWGLRIPSFADESMVITATDADNNVSAELMPETEITIDGNLVIFNMSSLPDGNYTLEIPEGYFLLDGIDYNAAVEVAVPLGTVSTGVNSIFAGGAETVVYNLQGVKVMNASSASDLNALTKGIYIVNGKKLVVK